ncbi:hypothetical protein JMJ77_0015122 [Colletotrichum scovillei]|uniref:Uncharacterized protein n=1 Tax=Colletotrichum scovillei TaxID=1209932 RepID=A0A9P7QZY5_9PEZI|nr:hypothetical protein JMJ77_0015122 [Colletotrichum scovillei]KAG7056745.1 hypothetical protein JMJ78_0000535 [Colletotrichum scovillei]KAG7066670.1 hypothetical protein JMJ76_0000524 [Colletotrichum scovillei]
MYHFTYLNPPPSMIFSAVIGEGSCCTANTEAAHLGRWIR